MKVSTVKTIARVLAIIGLVCAVGLAAVVTVYFFNITTDDGLLSTLSLVMVAATLIFFIPAYMLRKKAESMEAAEQLSDEPTEDEEHGDNAPPDVELISSREADDGEDRADDGKDRVDGAGGKDESKDGKE